MADIPATFVSAGHGPGVGNDPEAERAEPLGLFWFTGAGTEGAILQDDLQTVASGLPSTVPAGTPIYLWQGSVAATMAARVIAHNWLTTRYVFALSPGGTALFAIPQETYGTASGATDLAGWVYRHATGWRRWQPLGGAVPIPPSLLFLLSGLAIPGASSTTGQYGSASTPSLPYPSPTALTQPQAAGWTVYQYMRSAQRLACGQDGTVLAIANDGTCWCMAPGTASPGTQITFPTVLAGQAGYLVAGVTAIETTGTLTKYLALLVAWTVNGAGFINRQVIASYLSFVTSPVPIHASDWLQSTSYDDTTVNTGIVPDDLGNDNANHFLAPHYDGTGVLDASYVPGFTVIYADFSTRHVAAQLMTLPSPLPTLTSGYYLWSIYVDGSGTLNITGGTGNVKVCDVALRPVGESGTAGWGRFNNLITFDTAGANVLIRASNLGTRFGMVSSTLSASLHWSTESFAPTHSSPGGTVSGFYFGDAALDHVAFVQSSPDVVLTGGTNPLGVVITDVRMSGGGATFSSYSLSGTADGNVTRGAQSSGSSSGLTASDGLYVRDNGDLAWLRFGTPTTIPLTTTPATYAAPPTSGDYALSVPNPGTPTFICASAPVLSATANTITHFPPCALGISNSGGVLLRGRSADTYIGEGTTTILGATPQIPRGVGSGAFVPLHAGSSNPAPLTVGGGIFIAGTVDTSHAFAGACGDENATTGHYSLYAVDQTTGNLLRRAGNLGTTWTLVQASVVPPGSLIFWMARASSGDVRVSLVYGASGGSSVTRVDVDVTTSTVTTGAPITFPAGTGLLGDDFAVAAGAVPFP